jgi:hypothetical protein
LERKGFKRRLREENLGFFKSFQKAVITIVLNIIFNFNFY